MFIKWQDVKQIVIQLGYIVSSLMYSLLQRFIHKMKCIIISGRNYS